MCLGMGLGSRQLTGEDLPVDLVDLVDDAVLLFPQLIQIIQLLKQAPHVTLPSSSSVSPSP